MKASVRWIRELCPQLPDDPAAIAERLTRAGLEIESVESFGRGVDACHVAAVVSTRPHPSRTGLRLVTVDRGGPQQEVVCGAPNVPEPGGLVVLAPVGAHLPAKGMSIERRVIAGVPSDGMLCSEAELGLGSDESGILLLPAGSGAPGTPLSRALPFAQDTVLEIGVTPNRPDALGHVGLAREAAAVFEVPFALSRPEPPERSRADEVAKHVGVSIEDGERCPHYGASLLVDASVGASPLAIRWRLAALGVRSISNVVDVTNWIMLEFGHPLHAFDLDKVRGGAIVVRRARAGEILRTLDGVDRALDEDDLVICDGHGPVALAGVMGGSESEITPTTRRVLLECAYFDPRGVRRAARRHSLHTESSHRFERGVDWGDTRTALDRASSMVSKLAGATALGAAHLVEARPLARRTVLLRHERLCSVVGDDVPEGEASAILTRLGFAASPGDRWQVPSFRPDVSREADLIEEVARVRGYDAITPRLPAMAPSRDAAPREALARRARNAAVEFGLSEAVTLSFVSPRDLEAVRAPAPAITLLNPLGEERSVMRTSLLPGLLHAVARARRHGERDAALFSVGPVFLAPADGKGLPEERLAFAAVVVGDRQPWLSKPQPIDVWDAKGIAQSFVRRLARREALVRLDTGAGGPRLLHPRGAAWVEVAGQRAGSFGPLHPDVGDAFDLGDVPVVVVDLDLQALGALGAPATRYATLPRFPASARDLAVVVAEGIAAGDVAQAVRDAAGDLGENVALFDRFVGGAVPPGHASLALHVVYRAPDRTLTDAEVDARHGLVVEAVRKRFGATLRS